MPATPPPGRNDPCPCGSGLKYKRCCMLKLVVQASDEPTGPHTADYTGDYTQRDRDRALDKLELFLQRDEFRELTYRIGSALWGGVPEHVSDEQIGDMMHSEAGEAAFFNFFAFDAELEPGITLADVYLQRHGDALPSGEHAYLGRMRASHVRLYEVTSVSANLGLTLRDLLTGAEEFIHERSAATQLATWLLIAARVVQGPRGVPVFEAIDCVFPPTCKELLIDALRIARRERRKKGLANDEAAFFKRFAPVIQMIWMQRVAFRSMPTLTTADGDQVAFVKAVFDVRDGARVVAALRASPELHAESDTRFVWVEGDEDYGRVLGSFEVGQNRITYEGMSEARAIRARAFIEQIAGDAVQYRVTRVEDVAHAMARTKPAPGRSHKSRKGPRSDVPPGVEASMVMAYYDKYYREWLDIPLPALGNRTPRHAARLKTVRPTLVELLKDFESSAEQDRRAGRPAHDFAWMWGELGISPESGSGPAMDQRSHEERLAAIVKARSVKRARKMLVDIRNEIRSVLELGSWLAAARMLENRAVISRDVVCYLAGIFVECMTLGDSMSDPELSRIQDELTAIERAHGLGEDEFWHVREGPPEWTALNEAWDARADALMISHLRECGQGDLADVWEADQATFDEMTALGWSELLGDSRPRKT